MSEPLLSLRDIHVGFDTRRGRLPAVRGVSLDLWPGETLALVGESGSGKSALARAIVQLNQPPFTPNRTHVSGRMTLRTSDGPVELVGLRGRGLRNLRARHVAMIAQESLSGLNPVWRVGSQIAEALRSAAPGLDRAARADATLRIIEAVGLSDPPEFARRFPHQLSGGQRQRVMIAISMIRSPAIMIADEPTTALDVTIQARILRLLRALRNDQGMAMLFITHDLGVVASVADRIAVMYAGEVVETGPVARFLDGARHPYSAALIAMQPGNRDRTLRLGGQVPSPFARPDGCSFRNRCPFAANTCAERPVWLGEGHDGHRCWRPLA